MVLGQLGPGARAQTRVEDNPTGVLLTRRALLNGTRWATALLLVEPLQPQLESLIVDGNDTCIECVSCKCTHGMKPLPFRPQ